MKIYMISYTAGQAIGALNTISSDCQEKFSFPSDLKVGDVVPVVPDFAYSGYNINGSSPHNPNFKPWEAVVIGIRENGVSCEGYKSNYPTYESIDNKRVLKNKVYGRH